MQKVLVFIVSYNAQQTITKVLERLPKELFNNTSYSTEVLIIDDCSPDETFQTGYEFAKRFDKFPITILQNPKNLGYGGNQKVGYTYALQKSYDHVILLHGDGQYAPEELPRLVAPLVAGEADAVYGSRMINGADALKGGMPKYKFYGNKILTKFENFVAGTSLSEYHSGLRLYSCAALAKVPFQFNSDYFDFDTDIILQFHEAGLNILELPIPTFYGDEVCHVDGIKYARKIVTSCLLYRVQKWGIFYHPRFDIPTTTNQYLAKDSFPSSHSEALSFVGSDDQVLVLGNLPEEYKERLSSKVKTLYSFEEILVNNPKNNGKSIATNYEELASGNYEKILILDALEQINSPEEFLKVIRNNDRLQNTKILLTAGNVGFLPLRIMLLLGSFNYGKRGVLDQRKRRFFTFSSLRNLLSAHGFQIVKTRGLPAPFPLAFGSNAFANILIKFNELLILLSKRVFAYQICYEVELKPNVSTLLNRAISNTEYLIERKTDSGSTSLKAG